MVRNDFSEPVMNRGKVVRILPGVYATLLVLLEILRRPADASLDMTRAPPGAVACTVCVRVILRRRGLMLLFEAAGMKTVLVALSGESFTVEMSASLASCTVKIEERRGRCTQDYKVSETE